MNEEKDCTDKLTECHVSCEPNDKECISECVEDYHECVIPDADEVTCYIDEDEVDCDTWEYKVDEGEIIAEILTLTALLNGKCTRSSTLNSTGRSSKLITIEYDVQQRDKGSSQET